MCSKTNFFGDHILYTGGNHVFESSCGLKINNLIDGNVETDVISLTESRNNALGTC